MFPDNAICVSYAIKLDKGYNLANFTGNVEHLILICDYREGSMLNSTDFAFEGYIHGNNAIVYDNIVYIHNRDLLKRIEHIPQVHHRVLTMQNLIKVMSYGLFVVYYLSKTSFDISNFENRI